MNLEDVTFVPFPVLIRSSPRQLSFLAMEGGGPYKTPTGRHQAHKCDSPCANGQTAGGQMEIKEMQ